MWPLAEKIAQCLGDPLGKITLQNFPDVQFLARIDEDVRGRDVFVVQPTAHPVKREYIMSCLIIFGQAASGQRHRHHGPSFPVFRAIAEQDRKDQGRVPISAKTGRQSADHLGGQSRPGPPTCTAAQIQGFSISPSITCMPGRSSTK